MCSPTEACVFAFMGILTFISIMAGLQGFASRGSSLYLAPVFLGVRGVSYMGVR